MQIYLPIAEIPVNVFLIIGIGVIGGILAGMFGIGGGFLMTPLMIFIGIPPAVAVATSANQITASSISGFFAHLRRKNVDFKIGIIMIAGGFFGSTLGVYLFEILQNIGQIDLVISLTYVLFLGFVGISMAIESIKAIFLKRRGVEILPKESKYLSKLPFKVHFPASNINISILLPIAISCFTGMLVSIMGIGGGFIAIPAMIYIMGMPTSIVIGTSLFQIIFITANVTILHAVNTQSVDIVLASLLIVSAVLGAQLGTKIGAKLPAEKLRALLAIMVLSVVLKLASGFFIEPEDYYTISPIAKELAVDGGK